MIYRTKSAGFFLLGQLNWQAVIKYWPGHRALLTKKLQEAVF